ncbi:RICIN domain-containing protein [Kribbella yunnanensis]|uniref:RICIN domain-containing protein n=1 Tax=Kribbella yunnanensis TaxID=190194 RepID=UPI003CD08A5C
MRKPLAVATLVVITAAALLPSQAQAKTPRMGPTIEGYFSARNAGTQYCLDASASQGVRLQPCNSESTYQQWRRVAAAGPLEHLNSSGDCLDASASAGVTLKRCNGSIYQNWSFDLEARQWVHRQSNKVLDASISQGVAIKAPDFTSPYQEWTNLNR